MSQMSVSDLGLGPGKEINYVSIPSEQGSRAKTPRKLQKPTEPAPETQLSRCFPAPIHFCLLDLYLYCTTVYIALLSIPFCTIRFSV